MSRRRFPVSDVVDRNERYEVLSQLRGRKDASDFAAEGGRCDRKRDPAGCRADERRSARVDRRRVGDGSHLSLDTAADQGVVAVRVGRKAGASQREVAHLTVGQGREIALVLLGGERRADRLERIDVELSEDVVVVGERTG
jgi:hypothetical protein